MRNKKVDITNYVRIYLKNMQCATNNIIKSNMRK